MARGKRNYTLEEKLERVNNDIKDIENKLSHLKCEKEEIQEQLKLKKFDEINKMIEHSTKTYDDIIAFLVE